MANDKPPDKPPWVPDGAEEVDEDLFAIEEGMRRLVQRLREEGRPDDARALVAECLSILQDLNEGTLTADQLDEEAALQRAAYERQMAEAMARLVFLGIDRLPLTWSALGWDIAEGDRVLALSRDGGQIVLAMGALGSGKSHLAEGLIETTLSPEPGLTSAVHRRGAAIAFHTDLIGATLPPFLAGLRPNQDPEQLRDLFSLGVRGGKPLPRVNLAVPYWLLDEVKARLAHEDLPGLRIFPIYVRLSQLGQTALEALLSQGSDAQYVWRMLEVPLEQGDELTLAAWQAILDQAEELNVKSRAAIRARLNLLDKILGKPDGPGLWQLVEPGVLTVFYLAGKRIGKQHVAPLTVALLTALLQPSEEHGPFQRVIVLDEINRFDKDPVLWPVLLQAARQVRHQGMMLVLMGQDPGGMPDELLALVTVCALFKVRSPKVFGEIRERVGGLQGLRYEDVAELPTGTAMVVAATATDMRWLRARLTRIRPLCCASGGGTRAEI